MLIVPIESPVSGGAVRTFDVPVDLLLRVQVLQALEDLPQDGGDLGLVQGPRLQLGGHRQGGRTGVSSVEYDKIRLDLTLLSWCRVEGHRQ